MKKLDLNIKTLSVEIKVLKVDQKKMTLSVFNQIELEKGILNNKGELIVDVLGYVNKNGKWAIWVKDSCLKKTFLPPKDRFIKEWIEGYNWFSDTDYLFTNLTGIPQKEINKKEFAISYKSFYETFFDGKNQLFIAI